jgi:hypothetical protein
MSCVRLVQAARSRPPPHFSSSNITPWRVSSPAGPPDFACLVWRLTAVEEKNLFIQPLDLMHPPPRPDAARPPNRQERSPSLTPPSSSLGLLATVAYPGHWYQAWSRAQKHFCARGFP